MEAFLDAAERLLIREGAAGISTRQLAREAGQNHGLVHYYFGSVDELLLQTLERFTEPGPRPAAGDVRGRDALRREVAHRDRLHRGGP